MLQARPVFIPIPNATTVSRENAIPYIGKKKPGLSKQFGLSLKKSEPET